MTWKYKAIIKCISGNDFNIEFFARNQTEADSRLDELVNEFVVECVDAQIVSRQEYQIA